MRFCVSHHASKEPLTNVVTWAQLKQNLEAERPGGYVLFETAHPFVYPKIVDEFVKFLEKQFDLEEGPLPIENLCAFNISIAGLVNGDEKNNPGFIGPLMVSARR